MGQGALACCCYKKAIRSWWGCYDQPWSVFRDRRSAEYGKSLSNMKFVTEVSKPFEQIWKIVERSMYLDGLEKSSIVVNVTNVTGKKAINNI
ncbi:hypothetical protein D5086_010988 [Populus alba]|uniref:Uncharacterized protein n=1 Tax=Populus alba TaxID=43335 RepID=A0ACC4CBA7_POPAL